MYTDIHNYTYAPKKMANKKKLEDMKSTKVVDEICYVHEIAYIINGNVKLRKKEAIEKKLEDMQSTKDGDET